VTKKKPTARPDYEWPSGPCEIRISQASSLACAAATSAPSFCSSSTRFARAKPARWAATSKAATRSSRRLSATFE
jgi:hypothetical protein